MRTLQRILSGLLSAVLMVSLLSLSSQRATALTPEQEAHEYCDTYSTLPFAECEVYYFARQAAVYALPAMSARNVNPDMPTLAWQQATNLGTPTAYKQYVIGWQEGVSYMQGSLEAIRAGIDQYTNYLSDPNDPNRDVDEKMLAYFKKQQDIFTKASPIADQNAQAAENRAAEVYADFAVQPDGSIGVTLKSSDASVVSNTVVNGKVSVVIAVGGYQFAWIKGADAFIVYQAPPDPTPTPTPTPDTKTFSKVYAPTVSGTAKVGKTLTAKIKSWSPKASFTYQWKHNGNPISGATKKTYTLAATDLGATITLAVTGSRSGYTAVTKSSGPTKVVTLGSLAKGKVKVTGTKRVGRTLTAKTSKWSSGVTYYYQWYRNGKKLVGTTGKTYILTPADRGKKMKVKVWTTKDGYKTSSSRTSARTGKIGYGHFMTVTPVISGNAVVGETLTVNPGSWKPSETVFTYQWYRNGKKIKGATQATYLIQTADFGKKLTVKVTGKAPAYATASKTSHKTAKVTTPTTPTTEPSPSPSPGTTP